MHFSPNDMIEVLPLLAVVFGIFGVVLPAIVLSFVRKTLTDHEHLAGPLLFCGTVICVIGILVGGVAFLAAIGWLPPLSQLIHMR
ncbi:MAG: hypothetical protein HY812_03930 [Planctomycetes bacterium]|nr:hypothetical protein [Planctomycetota bacterium]